MNVRTAIVTPNLVDDWFALARVIGNPKFIA
jgi:hypothetical protein